MPLDASAVAGEGGALLPAEDWGRFHEVRISRQAAEPWKVLENRAVEGTRARADFDEGEVFSVDLPFAFDPCGDGHAESVTQGGTGGEVAAAADGTDGGRVVSRFRVVEGSQHPVAPAEAAAMACEDPAQRGGHAGWWAGAVSGGGAVTGGGDPFPAADGCAEDESGPCACGEAILCLGGEDTGDDDEAAGFGGGGDAVEGEGEDVEEDVGSDDIVLLAGLPCGHVVLCEAEAAGAVEFGIAVGDADGGGVVIESCDRAGTEEGGGDAEDAGAAAEVEEAPWLEPVAVGVISDEAEAGTGGGVVAGAEGHFTGNGEDDAVRVEAPHFTGGFLGMADDEAAADGNGLEGGGRLGGPVA